MPLLSYTYETLPSQQEFRRQLAKAETTTNPIDDLLQLADELRCYEACYGMTSAEFYRQFEAGRLNDELQHCIEWAADCTSFLKLKRVVGYAA